MYFYSESTGRYSIVICIIIIYIYVAKKIVRSTYICMYMVDYSYVVDTLNIRPIRLQYLLQLRCT